MPDDIFGVSMLVLIIYVLAMSLVHAIFIKLAAAFVVSTNIRYGEAFQVAFMIAILSALVGGIGGFLFTQMAISAGSPTLATFGNFFIFVVNVLVGILLVSKMVKDERLRPIGMGKGFLVWLVSYILWIAVGCFCGLVCIGF